MTSKGGLLQHVTEKEIWSRVHQHETEVKVPNDLKHTAKTVLERKAEGSR